MLRPVSRCDILQSSGRPKTAGYKVDTRATCYIATLTANKIQKTYRDLLIGVISCRFLVEGGVVTSILLPQTLVVLVSKAN